MSSSKNKNGLDALLTPQTSAVVLIDHQPFQFANLHSHEPTMIVNNVVGLADASPAGYKEKGRFQIADQGWPSWAHPVVCGGRFYIRNQGTLACYDIKAR